MKLPDQANTHIHNQIISHAPPTTPAITTNDTALSPPLLQGSTLPLPTKLEPGGRVILRGLMDNHGKHEPSAWSSSSLQVANSYLNSTEGKPQNSNQPSYLRSNQQALLILSQAPLPRTMRSREPGASRPTHKMNTSNIETSGPWNQTCKLQPRKCTCAS